MNANTRKIVSIGDLVVAAFDVAAGHCSDPRDISAFATKLVLRMLLGARKVIPIRHHRKRPLVALAVSEG